MRNTLKPNKCHINECQVGVWDGDGRYVGTGVKGGGVCTLRVGEFGIHTCDWTIWRYMYKPYNLQFHISVKSDNQYMDNNIFRGWVLYASEW